MTFTGGVIAAEVAATGGARDTGLMNRPSLGAANGMLFVFPSDQPVTGFAPFFWMKNTLIDLSIAFMDASSRVIDVQEMVARDTVTEHRPPSPYRYAVEANKGWFATHGVAAGAAAAFTISSCTVITP